jgi:hypothetical protein
MARQTIVVSGEPKGHFIEGKLATGSTPKPGTCVSLTSAGLYEPWNGAADGEQDEVIVLVEDAMQGKTVNDAYADSAHIFMYMPLAGDEIQVLFGNVAGTADEVAIGDKLMIDDGTGKAINTTGSPEMEPFKALEAYVDPAADKLLLVRCTGK